MDTTLALATVALAVATFWLAIESKKASIRQIGVQTWLELKKQFDSAEFKKARVELAQLLLRNPPYQSGEVSEDVMNFFEDLGTLYRRGYIDEKLAESTF